MLRRWFMPNPPGAMLLALVLIVQALMFQRSYANVGNVNGLIFGFPSLLHIHVHPSTKCLSVDDNWLVATAMFAGTWVIAMPLGRLMTDAGVDPQSGVA